MFKTAITWSILTIIAIHCEEPAATNATTYQVSLIQEKQCPFLFYYNNKTTQCECLSNLFGASRSNVVKCASGRALLHHNYCMTYTKETSIISLSYCTYFNDHIISEPGYIDLPYNISELNDYMCGSMNRKGIVCSECIDGYGPSVTSPNYRCSDCTNAWYGVPLYLLLELVPVTVFYLIVLIFKLNITSAPMPIFIFYSNMVLFILNFRRNTVIDQSHTSWRILVSAYGIWSLDFFHYAIPPFCISPNFETIHILYLQSVSAVFPLILVALTWICIKLHSRDCKIVVWTWQLLNKVIFKHINVKWNSSRTVVDAFATFFLLSFSKITLILFLPLFPLKVDSLNNIDHSSSFTIHSFLNPRVDFISKEHLLFVVISIAIFLFAVFPLVVLIALYPIEVFRTLLLKCLPKQSIAPLNIFVEKFYSCYRDGLDGGRDMRSLASLSFFILLFSYIIVWSGGTLLFFLLPTLFGGCSLFIANIQPYKKKTHAVIDSLLLANLALIYTALNTHIIYAPSFFQIVVGISTLIPALGLFSFVVYKLLKKPFKPVFVQIKQKLPQVKSQLLLTCCKGHINIGDRARDEEQGSTNNDRDEIQLPDRIVHPELYTEN